MRCTVKAEQGADVQSSRAVGYTPRMLRQPVTGFLKSVAAGIATFALVSLAAVSCARGPVGTWTGSWIKNGDALPVVVTFRRTEHGFAGSFTSDALQVADIPFGEVRSTPPAIHFVLAGDAATTTFDGSLIGNLAEGTFREGDSKGSFRLIRSRVAPPGLRTRDAAFRDGDVRLAGTLLLPARRGLYPAIVFLHGSGPEGRWANRYLAQRFVQAGFVALITDKRGVGQSTGDWRTAGFEELASDAVSGIRYLEAQPEVDRRRIGIYGHSPGGTLAPMVAVRSGDAAFIIASAAGGVDPADMEEYSVGNAIGIATLPPSEADDARAFVRAIVDVAYRGKPRATLDALWAEDKGRSWYFDPPPQSDPYWSFSQRIATYDPPGWWRRVSVPVLLVFGEKDERVPPRRSSDAITAALRAGGDNDVTLRMFSNADHIFTLPASGGWPKRVPDYADVLTAVALAKTR